MSRKKEEVAGFDIGGTGIKGAIVDIRKGTMLSDRIKIPTPQPSTPANVAKTMLELGKLLNIHKGEIAGCGFPAVVVRGVTKSAANVDKKWLDFETQKYLTERTKYKISLLNDADAAGLAELHFGRAKNRKGTILLLTLGTGIGSALFVDGKLVPNTEFGHLRYHDGIAEDYASNRARKDQEMTYKVWARQLDGYLKHLAFVINPDLIILGGGVSKRFSTFKQYLDPGVEVISAKLRNDAGVIGAALYAYYGSQLKK